MPKKENVDTITDTTLFVEEAPQPARENASDTKAPITPPSQRVLPQIKRDSRIFMLTNDKRQGNVIMDFEEEVYDPETKRTRAMRVIRRAPSIWLDEQPASNFTSQYVQKNTRTVLFQRGKAAIPIHETAILKAMELSNRNVDNPHRQGVKDIYFKEWNPAIENAKAIAEENDVIKAMGLAIKAPEHEMVQHASYLNIQFVDEQGIPFDEEALRAEYTRFAKNNPRKFLTSIQSPTVKVAYMVRKAFDNGKIDLGLQPGTAYWQDGGFITALPEGRDALEYLIEYAMTHGDDNARFANQLRELS